jgi:hypothetical protein
LAVDTTTGSGAGNNGNFGIVSQQFGTLNFCYISHGRSA